MRRVLVVDRDPTLREELRAFLTSRGLRFRDAASVVAAEHAMGSFPFDIVLVDAQLVIEASEDVLARLAQVDARVQFVLLATTAELGRLPPRARRRADHVLMRPVDPDALDAALQQLLRSQQTRRRSLAENALAQRRGRDPFLGASRAVQELAEEAHRVLDSHAPVLIQGETGTGKGVLARWFHEHGPRAEEAFVDINCAGLSKELLESELFGHERGAFTGATAPKLGLLDVAHKGTAFLDEIGEMDVLLQPRLLKVLEEKRFRRIGDVRDHTVDVRLIAATNRDLATRARQGTFRADLLYRINTISLTLPPLRARREDIPQLARQLAHELGHDIELADEASAALQAYAWPGNVRELRNVIERAILTSRTGARIGASDLAFERGATPLGPAALDLDPPCADAELGTLEEAERRHIERVLRHEQGSVDRAAVRLGVSRSTLYQKLRRHRLGAGRA